MVQKKTSNLILKTINVYPLLFNNLARFLALDDGLTNLEIKLKPHALGNSRLVIPESLIICIS